MNYSLIYNPNNYIVMLAAGKRKMNKKVRRLVETLIDFRKTLDEIL